MTKPVVTIVMGSDSDLAVMDEAAKVLELFEVPYEMTVSSAHRAPDRTLKIAATAEKKRNKGNHSRSRTRGASRGIHRGQDDLARNRSADRFERP